MAWYSYHPSSSCTGGSSSKLVLSVWSQTIGQPPAWDLGQAPHRGRQADHPVMLLQSHRQEHQHNSSEAASSDNTLQGLKIRNTIHRTKGTLQLPAPTWTPKTNSFCTCKKWPGPEHDGFLPPLTCGKRIPTQPSHSAFAQPTAGDGSSHIQRDPNHS